MKERLDKILVQRGIAKSRMRAQDMITSGKIEIGGAVITNLKREFDNSIEINVLEEDMPWVSRSALKLIKALDTFQVNPSGKICLDIGSSTGGFTQVLLSRNAAHVYAIDVGTNQFDSSLLPNDKITLKEGTHINDVDKSMFGNLPSLIVIDVSFISLTKILDKVSELLDKNGDVIALIKPQFEVGKENTKKGIVRNPELYNMVCDNVRNKAVELGFTPSTIIESPIHGGDGNVEFLIHLTK